MTDKRYSPKLTFSQWMHNVDLVIACKAGGLESTDLPDYCYRDEYEDGTSPTTAANRAIRAACYE